MPSRSATVDVSGIIFGGQDERKITNGISWGQVFFLLFVLLVQRLTNKRNFQRIVVEKSSYVLIKILFVQSLLQTFWTRMIDDICLFN